MILRKASGPGVSVMMLIFKGFSWLLDVKGKDIRRLQLFPTLGEIQIPRGPSGILKSSGLGKLKKSCYSIEKKVIELILNLQVKHEYFKQSPEKSSDASSLPRDRI